MKKTVNDLIDISNSNQIQFVDNYYLSSDGYTILGEVEIKYLLFIPYRDTDAGSNPREYYGFKKANIDIFKSMLSHPDTFRFLHSGVIVSMIGVQKLEDKKTIIYTDACLTNGNQTRFLFLLIVLILMNKHINNTISLTKQKFNDLIKTSFENSNAYAEIINRVNYSKINHIVNFLRQNNKYRTIIETLSLEDFLKLKVRIQLNLINPVVENSNNRTDEYSLGTLIAEANNNTQYVKKDDIFGNKYKDDLEKNVFVEFEKIYGNSIKIEYVQGEVSDSNKVHILTLLRPIISVGLLTKENQIYNYSNQREPVYRLFEKLLKNKKASNTIKVVSKCIPFLYDIRINYLTKSLEKHKRNLISDYIKKGVNGDLDDSIIGTKIMKSNYDDNLIEREVKSLCRYNIEHIAPVLFFRIRNLLKMSKDEKVFIDVTDDSKKKLIDGLSDSIYKKYIEDKFNGLPTSLTTLVRGSEFFKYGEEAYSVFKSIYNLVDTNFINENRYPLIK